MVVVGEDEVGLAVAVDVAVQPPSVSKLSVMKWRCQMMSGFFGFSYHQRPLIIQPVVTTSGAPSWLTSKTHSPQSDTNSSEYADGAELMVLPLAALRGRDSRTSRLR